MHFLHICLGLHCAWQPQLDRPFSCKFSNFKRDWVCAPGACVIRFRLSLLAFMKSHAEFMQAASGVQAESMSSSQWSSSSSTSSQQASATLSHLALPWRECFLAASVQCHRCEETAYLTCIRDMEFPLGRGLRQQMFLQSLVRHAYAEPSKAAHV